MFADVNTLLASALAWLPPACRFERAHQDYQRGSFAYALRQCYRLARQGNGRAARLIGDMHRNGEGVRQDLTAAMKWYARAARAGDEVARRMLNVEGAESEERGHRKRPGLVDGAVLRRAPRISARRDNVMPVPAEIIHRGDSLRGREFGSLGKDKGLSVVSEGLSTSRGSAVVADERGAPLQEGRLGESRGLRAIGGSRAVSASREDRAVARLVRNVDAPLLPDTGLRDLGPNPVFGPRHQPAKSDQTLSNGGLSASPGLKDGRIHGLESFDHGRDALSARGNDGRYDVNESVPVAATGNPDVAPLDAEVGSQRTSADAPRYGQDRASLPLAKESDPAVARDRNRLGADLSKLLVTAARSDSDVVQSSSGLLIGEEVPERKVEAFASTAEPHGDRPGKPTNPGAPDDAASRGPEEGMLPNLNVESLKTRAETGDTDAMLELAAMYRIGLSATSDAVAAAEWYRRAAADGSAEAQFQLGRMYHKGQGVRRNRAHSISWTRRAALGGHSRAPYELGFVLAENPRSVSELIRSYAWLSIAYESGLGSAVDLRDTVAAELSETHLEEAARVQVSIQAEMTGA